MGECDTVSSVHYANKKYVTCTKYLKKKVFAVENAVDSSTKNRGLKEWLKKRLEIFR